MTEAETLATALLEWRRLTELESAAIREVAWDRVAALQQAKASLQASMMAMARDNDSEEVGDPAEEEECRRLARELIQMERANLDLVLRLRAQAEKDQASLEVSRGNLKRIHRTLVPKTRSSWQRLS